MDFVKALNDLINTIENIEILSEAGVIINELGDSQKAVSMFNKLNEWTYSSRSTFYYHEVCKDVRVYCFHRRYTWLRDLYKSHFSTPWSICKLLVAILLLVLTII